MAKDLESALAPSLAAAPVPTRGPELVRYAGGRRALTEQLSGMSGPPKRAAYRTDDEYRAASIRWRSASRRAQRWDDQGRAGKQTRGQAAPVKLAPPEKGRLRRQATVRKRDLLAERGARVRIRALVVVPSGGLVGRGDNERVRTLPSGGPGVFIKPSVVRQVLADIRAGADPVDAFFNEFLLSYGMPDTTELVEVYWLKVWPEGTPEPA